QPSSVQHLNRLCAVGVPDLFDEAFEVVIVLQYLCDLSKGVQSHASIRGHDEDVLSIPLKQVSQDKHTI
ncbi:hypothetical protein, partial [Escherichia coli]|uniref:hypothetical protein n=1 Tax=Escherichia coli TaxID=562 RepID=UPI00273813C6